MQRWGLLIVVFFFNDTATTEIYTLSLHDALPIYLARRDPAACDRDHAHLYDPASARELRCRGNRNQHRWRELVPDSQDRKSTRLNSSHANISYAVFCLKKKKKIYVREVLCLFR